MESWMYTDWLAKGSHITRKKKKKSSEFLNFFLVRAFENDKSRHVLRVLTFENPLRVFNRKMIVGNSQKKKDWLSNKHKHAFIFCLSTFYHPDKNHNGFWILSKIKRQQDPFMILQYILIILMDIMIQNIYHRYTLKQLLENKAISSLVWNWMIIFGGLH